jgi:single-stranded DNA-specific DHH superfamily exonuclease
MPSRARRWPAWRDFYVLLALRAHLRRAGRFDAGPDIVLLDLVAIGTVADLVPMDLNNRALVGAGLRRLRAGQGHAGVRALIARPAATNRRCPPPTSALPSARA